MYLLRPPLIQKALFSQFIWNQHTKDNTLYLTFDDGPTPDVTDFVLSTLNDFQAEATFFVKGINAEKYPQIIQKIIDQGHVIGNHTYDHPNGWKMGVVDYLQSVKRCDEVLRDQGVKTDLFRPPYGRITPKQSKAILPNYRIVMWSCLSGDFDPNLRKARSERAIIGSGPGEILVFHDSKKAFDNLRQLLPFTLAYFAEKGFQFKKIK